jgi:nucleotide-binding universal stress UspA family protein
MKILVAVDKTEESQVALRFACHLMEHFVAIVDALYVKPDVVETVTGGGGYVPFTLKSKVEREIEKETKKTVEEIIEGCAICVGKRLPCNPFVASGDPAAEILNFAKRDYYDLIILGSPGKSLLRGLLQDTVPLKVLHQAEQSVLILRNFRPIHKILVAYRGSQCDQGALDFIAPLFAKNKPEITVMHVREMEPGESGESGEFAEVCLRTGDETLRRHGFAPLKKIAQGEFVEEILKAVAIDRYDLLVLGAYEPNPKYLKGRSDEVLELVRLTTRPVLVYREDTYYS